MNLKNIFACRWSKCDRLVANIIIYGCHNGHIYEYAVCSKHTVLWIAAEADTGIYCHQRSCDLQTGPDYQIVPLTLITEEYVREYIETHPRTP